MAEEEYVDYDDAEEETEQIQASDKDVKKWVIFSHIPLNICCEHNRRSDRCLGPDMHFDWPCQCDVTMCTFYLLYVTCCCPVSVVAGWDWNAVVQSSDKGFLKWPMVNLAISTTRWHRGIMYNHLCMYGSCLWLSAHGWLGVWLIDAACSIESHWLWYLSVVFLNRTHWSCWLWLCECIFRHELRMTVKIKRQTG